MRAFVVLRLQKAAWMAWIFALLAAAPLYALALAPTGSSASVQALGKDLNESVLQITVSSVEVAELEVTWFKPPGDGPFPTLFINHGKSVGAPKEQTRARYYTVARDWVRRGYQVFLPMRRGFAASSGKYVSYGCDMHRNALNQARDIVDVARALRERGIIDSRPIILFGQSYGGLASVAAASFNQIPIALVVSFAGGLKSTSSTRPCDWEAGLVDAMRQLGQKNTVPMMWFYGENDSYFSPDLARRMHEAFTASGGKAQLTVYPAFKQDAHKMFGDTAGFPIWVKPVADRMTDLGFSTHVRFVTGTMPRPVASSHAAADDISAVPVRSSGKTAYENFLTKWPPRAFAIGENGAWGWASGRDDAVESALGSCQKFSKEPCRLYAVDEDVVWDK